MAKSENKCAMKKRLKQYNERGGRGEANKTKQENV